MTRAAAELAADEDIDPNVSILSLSGVSKSFPGVRALDDVALEIGRSEIVALVGQNGCGKSTLIKILAGYYQPDAGAEIRFDGAPTSLSPEIAERLGIAFVHQDLGLIDELSIMENIAVVSGFPTRGPRGLGVVAWKRLRAETQKALADLGHTFDVELPVGALAASERVAVAMVRAVLGSRERPTRLLVLDEPTASLPQSEVDRLFETVERLRARGVSIIFVSHRLDEVFALCERVVVMRNGRAVGTYDTAHLDAPALVELMLGHPIASHEEQPQRPSTIAGQEPMFRVEGLAGGTLAGLDLEVWPGEVVGVCGLTGSGREAVAGLMFGASPRRGRVWVSGTEVVRSSPRDSKHAGLALVPAERRRSALLSDADVRENLVLAGLRTISRLRVLSRRKERLEVHSWIGRMAIKTPSGRFPIINLSGGNQQKVILARWLRLHPRVLILDEPTQGVDIGAKQEIYNHLRAIAAAGTSVIICSTDSEEIVEACDRALVLSQGRLHAELAGPALTLNHLNHTIAAA